MLTPGFLYQKRIPLDCTTGSVFSAYGGKKEYNRLGNARSTVVPKKYAYIKGFVQDCSNSIANALELLQFCTKSLINGLCFGFCCGQAPGTKWYLGWYQIGVFVIFWQDLLMDLSIYDVRGVAGRVPGTAPEIFNGPSWIFTSRAQRIHQNWRICDAFLGRDLTKFPKDLWKFTWWVCQ